MGVGYKLVIALILLVIGAHNTYGADGPLCTGEEIVVTGNALAIPRRAKPLDDEKKKRLIPLATDARDFSQFTDIPGSRTFPVSLSQENVEAAYESLKSGKWKDDVVLSISTEENESDRLKYDLNGLNLKEYQKTIADRWVNNEGTTSETVFFEMFLQGANNAITTVFIGLRKVSQAANCQNNIDVEDEDVSPPRPITAPEPPKDFPFRLPMQLPLPPIMDFYGPRIFTSSNLSLSLESGVLKPPTFLKFSMDNLKWNGQWKRHGGVDFEADTGDEIHAVYDGMVYSVGRYVSAAGKCVIVRHDLPGPLTVFSVYMHLSSFAKNVKPGDWIQGGNLVGYAGATGRATGVHLHLELREPKLGVVLAKNKPEDLKDTRKEAQRVGRMWNQTVTANPSEYIAALATKCSTRKNIEVLNTEIIVSKNPRRLGPLTAGECDPKVESALFQRTKALKIYSIKDKSQLKAL